MIFTIAFGVWQEFPSVNNLYVLSSAFPAAFCCSEFHQESTFQRILGSMIPDRERDFDRGMNFASCSCPFLARENGAVRAYWQVLPNRRLPVAEIKNSDKIPPVLQKSNSKIRCRC
jgi:hypothetical protein